MDRSDIFTLLASKFLSSDTIRIRNFGTRNEKERRRTEERSKQWQTTTTTMNSIEFYEKRSEDTKWIGCDKCALLLTEWDWLHCSFGVSLWSPKEKFNATQKQRYTQTRNQSRAKFIQLVAVTVLVTTTAVELSGFLCHFSQFLPHDL